MKTFYSLLLIISASLFLAGCNDDDPAPTPGTGGSGGGSGGGGGGTGGDETTTTFGLSVEVPEGVTVAMNDPFNPLDWMTDSAVAADVAVEDLDLDNFEVRLFDPDGDGLDGENDYQVIDSSQLELTDLGGGNYELSVPGEPRLDCVIVTKLTIGGSGDTLELQVPTTRDPAVNSEPLRLNYASTAATRQYVQQAVSSGGFDDGLSVEEVDALIEEVAQQVASVPIPEGTDLGDPDAVFAVLDSSARDLVEAQIEIAAAPPAEEGTLAARQGNYHAAFFGRSVFAQNEGFFLEHEFFYEDFSIVNATEHETPPTLSGVPITVDETAKTAAITLGTEVEAFFGSELFGSPLFEETFFGLDVFSDDEDIPAKILNDGTLIVNPGTGRIDGGSLCDEIDCDSRLYFAEINNALNFRLKPWGEAYVGSAFFRFDEYALNDFEDTTLSCLLALSQVQEGFTEENLASLTEDAFETLIESLADQPGAAATLASECTHNAVGHEVLAISFAKEASDHTLADLDGSWGVVGFEVGHEFERGVFSSVVTIDGQGQGAMQESDYRGFYALPDDDGQGNVSVRIEADTQALSGTASIDADGFVGFDFGEGEVDTGFISSDEGLIYIGGRDAGNNEFQELEGEAFVAYGVPLGTDVTAADIDGKTFSFVGLSMSLEGGLTAGYGQVSSNHDSNAGMTISFASTANGLVATLGGSTDLGILDQTFQNGEVTGYASSIVMDDPADGEVNVDLESNGAFTVRIDGDTAVADDEDLYVRGFYDANGRIIMSIASGSAGFLADTLGQVTETVQFADAAGYDFVNFGYLLGTCSSGCSAQ